jgi:hypothetical protein
LEEAVRKASSAEADGEGAERSSSARRREIRGRTEEEEAMGVGGLRNGRSGGGFSSPTKGSLRGGGR